MAQQTYYTLLGIKFNATTDEINAAFRRISKAYHPDAGAKDSEMFRHLVEAHDVLSDAGRRAHYDCQQVGNTPPMPPSPATPPRPRRTRVAEGSQFNDPGPQFRTAPLYVRKGGFAGWLRNRSWPLLGVAFASYELLRWSESLTSSSGTKLNSYAVSSLTQLLFYLTFALFVAFATMHKMRVRALWLRIRGHFHKYWSRRTATTHRKDESLPTK